MQTKNIPATLLAGMFFFSAYAAADPLPLATDLFEKGEWALCRRECQRALMDNAEPAEHFQLLSAMSQVRSEKDPLHAADLFKAVIATNADVQVTSIASYELGRLQWRFNQPAEALDSFELAFHTTTNKTLFLQASCSMFLLFKEHPELKKGQDDLVSQINTSRDQWFGALFSQCAKPDPEKDKPEAPSWFIRFYRHQISPAIGNRCVLEPSCSEYFHQAKVKHGMKAYAMIGDRFFREPEVSNQKEYPVVMKDGQIRYRDPVDNHDFWMKK